jgi:hypothetical protein
VVSNIIGNAVAIDDQRMEDVESSRRCHAMTGQSGRHHEGFHHRTRLKSLMYGIVDQVRWIRARTESIWVTAGNAHHGENVAGVNIQNHRRTIDGVKAMQGIVQIDIGPILHLRTNAKLQ